MPAHTDFTNRPQSLTQFVMHLLRPHPGWIGLYVLLSIFASLWGVFNSLFLKVIIDRLGDISDPSTVLSAIFWPAVLLVINFEVHNLSWRGIHYVNYHIQPVVKNRAIEQAFSYVNHQAHQFFQDNFSGKIASNISLLASNIEIACFDCATHLIRGVVVVVASLISMYFVNPLFAYGLGSWVGVFCALSLVASQRIVHLADAYAEAESDVSGQVVDAVSNAQNMRFFSRYGLENERLQGVLETLKNRFRTKTMYLILFHLCQGLSLTVLFAFMVYTLISLRMENQVSLGDFALIISLTIDVGWTLWWVMDQVDRFNDAVGKGKQSMKALFTPLEINDHPNAKDLVVSQGRIEFKNVKFHYKGSEPLFYNKSVVIEPGQKVGLVGYSGSGKSTFVNLILRLYDIAEGHLLIDGQDVRDVSQDSLRSAIGMIPQDPSLFHRSLWDNIRYGKPDASDGDVIDAAKRAHAHEFINLMPQGYGSLVGERGVKLSGGQRQRIAIARAILKNAPLLILDEATSQLDSVTEAQIQESLWHLMQGKTTLVIAHRLSTLLHMDRILVFDRGKIVEDGTHDTLLDQRGLYAILWNAQVGGFLPETQTPKI